MLLVFNLLLSLLMRMFCMFFLQWSSVAVSGEAEETATKEAPVWRCQRECVTTWQIETRLHFL